MERNVPLLALSTKSNGAQRLVKAPFLAQIDFSWSRQKWYSNTKIG